MKTNWKIKSLKAKGTTWIGPKIWVSLAKEGGKMKKMLKKQYKIKMNECKTRSNKGVTWTIIDTNTMEFIHMNVHPWFVMNLYVNPSLVLVHSQLISN